MPRFLVPKRSGAHRVGCIALYRAILQQCRIIPVSDNERSALQNVARNRFRQNRELHSHLRLNLAFRAGYEALDLLDASAAGDASSTTRVTSLLSRTPAYLTRPPKRPGPKLKKSLNDPTSVACRPPLFKALDTRPHTTVTGIRQVPKLVNANAFPFLRYKKPQPASLSRVLRDQVEQKQRRVTLRNELNDVWIPLGMQEDQWDRIVMAQCGDLLSVDKTISEPLWLDAPRESLILMLQHVEAQKEKGRLLAARMQEIVDKEQALADEEKRLRREERWQRKKEEGEARRAEEVTKTEEEARKARRAVRGDTRSEEAQHEATTWTQFL